MLRAFTKNCQDNSTDAGFQFTFACDVCQDGFKTSFIQSETYKKRLGSRILGEGAGIVGSILGGRARQLGSAAQRGTNVLSQTFDGKSPEWQKEHETAFERGQNEARQHFHRCPHCYKYVCDHCWNEDEGLCVSCAPRQEVYVAQARAQAMKRNIDQAGQSATVWQGAIESKATICPSCGKPAGTGKFCNNCGANMDLKECPKCGTRNAPTVRFCNNCGENLQQPKPQAVPQPEPQAAAASVKCPSCGCENPPGTKFCAECGENLQQATPQTGHQAAAQEAICPSCGEPAGTGKFCNSCGAKLEQVAPQTEHRPEPPAPAAAPSGKCPSCGFDNPPGLKFCGECGAKLGQTAPQPEPPPAAAPSGVCPSCGFDNPPGLKFCGECGNKLGESKTVCAACGRENSAGMKFCADCGAKL